MKRSIIAANILSIAIPFIWFGMVVGISFIEAPLKFTAPNVTLELGVGIGKVVFAAVNKIEWILFTTWLISIWYSRSVNGFNVLLIIITLLSLQTFWLLPQLDARIENAPNGKLTSPGLLHAYYIVAELIKVTSLIVVAICRASFTVSKFNHLQISKP